MTGGSVGRAPGGAPSGRSPLDAGTVRRIAGLAGLALTDAEVLRFAAQFDAILTHFASLSAVAVDGVEPLAHPLGLTDVLRDDVAQDGLSRDDALSAAPDAEQGTFRVRRIAPEREP